MGDLVNTADQICLTGIPGLDHILGGGLPRHRLYMVEGDPGVGKTTLGLQFLLEGARNNEKVLYITLSETKDELLSVARSHGWSLEKIHLFELSAVEQQLRVHESGTFFHPSETELLETTQTLLNEVERLNPDRVVFDSLSEMRLLSETALRHRRQILSLKSYFSKKRCTVLLLDDRSTEGSDQQVQSLAHGVISLECLSPDYGVVRRRGIVKKVRGLKFREGYHDYVILKGGIEFFPRLVAAEHHSQFTAEHVSSGLAELDTMLGGGLDRGTSTILMGAAGTGKSTTAIQYATSAASRGEGAAFFLFDETLGTLYARTKSIGMDLDRFVRSGKLTLQQIDPAELSPGEFVHAIRKKVEENQARMVIIDSLNSYLNAMPAERFLHLQMREMFTYLSQKGIVTLATLAQQGLIGPMQSQVDLSYLADTILLFRYFEAAAEVRQAVSVIKKRSGMHERTIRELHISSKGIRVGEPLREFHGVLSGIPTFTGRGEAVLPRSIGIMSA
jgi:circadian clock protein KaiC